MKVSGLGNHLPVSRPFPLCHLLALALGSGLIGQSSAQLADQWAQWDQPNPAVWAISLVWGHNTLVALSGDVLTSADGKSWTRTLNLGSAGLMASGEGLILSPHLFFANGLFILTAEWPSADGLQGAIALSKNAVNWEVHRGAHFLASLRNMTVAGDQIFAIGSDNVIYSSPDAVTWTERGRPPGATLLTGLAFGNGHFIASGQHQVSGDFHAPVVSTIYSSQEGVSWVVEAEFPDVVVRLKLFARGKFMATSFGSTQSILTSSDGLTWSTNLTQALPFHQISFGPAGYGNGWFVLLTANGNGVPGVLASLDGQTWTEHSVADSKITFAAAPDRPPLAFGGDRFWTTGDSGVIARSGPIQSPYALSANGLTSNGSMRLSIAAPPNARMLIEASSDLQSWRSVGEFSSSSATSEFIDSSAGTRTHTFYRVAVP